ncbi:glycerophosphodiester phosphodiesterase [Candidatus Solirubrobacter pratensis]|uniref:glycerophosphodiester phosphodiesterase n=1 Tax=Candidatus Solirubrobacter pratensis TaxID=1298857 RepID=UPI00048A0E1D|nr:glycerophosphodiester phosphodiesterase [Candidatus Solirubrobacter pratensis]
MSTPVRGGAALVAALALLVSLPAAASAARHRHGETAKPTIYGHRGASGYRPEHTLASYRLAARMGADYIEPDLVMTKDHVLVVRHEPAIGGTTDVAKHPEFASRRKTKVIDGVTFADDWFVEDFTLAELKTLRAVERLPDLRRRNTIYNGRYTVPTFQEVIDLRDQLSRELGRKIGIIPELKHSTYHRSIGLPLEELFVQQLRRNRLDDRSAKVTVQSFEVSNLKWLDKQIPNPLVQLLDAKTLKPGDVLASGGSLTYGQMATPAGLREIAKYADIASPSKDYIVPRDAAGASLAPTSFIGDAHRAGLDVVAYTFRVENSFLPLELRSSANPADAGNLFAEIKQFFDLGIDGVFTDNADIAKAVRDDE